MASVFGPRNILPITFFERKNKKKTLVNKAQTHGHLSVSTYLKKPSKISITSKTQDGDNSESLNKLILNKILVPCDIYRSHLS